MMLDHVRNQSATIVHTTTDKYGDQKVSSEDEVLVRFRYITDLDKNTNREGLQADAMMWFAPDADVSEGSILYIEDEYWRITRLIKARKMDSEVHFLKALLNRHEL